MTAVSPLIEPAELAARLGDDDIVLVDCRYDLFDHEAGRRQYLESHIPAARYASLERDLAGSPTPADGRHPLPEPTEFARRLGELGIKRTHEVIVYDSGPPAIAGRLWWMLKWIGHQRIRVLNGGLRSWRAAGLPLEAGDVKGTTCGYGDFAAVPELILTSGSVPQFLQQGGLLLDARSSERFRGEEEPLDPIAGHIPGAFNLPFTALLQSDGRLLPPLSLRKLYHDLMGQRPASRVAAMCGSGVTACLVLLALETAGLGEGRLYAGSWSEWIRNPGRPVVCGRG